MAQSNGRLHLSPLSLLLILFPAIAFGALMKAVIDLSRSLFRGADEWAPDHDLLPELPGALDHLKHRVFLHDHGADHHQVGPLQSHVNGAGID